MATWFEKLRKIAQEEKEKYEQEQQKQKEAAAAGIQKLKEIAKKAKQEAEEEKQERKENENKLYAQMKNNQKKFISSVKNDMDKTVREKSTKIIDDQFGLSNDQARRALRMSTSSKAQLHYDTVDANLERITENKKIAESNKNLWNKHKEEGRAKGLWGEELEQYIWKNYINSDELQSEQPRIKKTQLRTKNLQTVIDTDYTKDSQYYQKIKAGQKNDVFYNGALTSDEAIFYAEGWSDSYMTNYREFLDKEALKKLWYLKGDQEITGVDHSQEIKDLADAIIADAQQRYEYDRYQTGDYAKNNYYLETPFQGAASTVQGWTNTLQRLFGNISAPVVTAEQIAYQEKLNDAKGFKRIFGLTGYSAAQMITSGGSGGFFFSIAGNTYGQARREGYSDSEALTYAVVNAGLEVGMRRAFGTALGGVNKFVGKDSLFKSLVRKVIKNPVAQKSVSIAGDMLGEGIEEYSQAVIDPFVRNMVLGEDNEIDLTPEGGGEAFLVGMLVAGSCNSVNYATNLSADMKTANAGLKLNDGTVISADALNRVFAGRAMPEDMKLMAEFGNEITEDEYRKIINRIEQRATVSYGEKTFSQIKQETLRLSPAEKIDYYATVLGSEAYQMSVMEYMKKAKSESIQNNINKKIDDKYNFSIMDDQSAAEIKNATGIDVKGYSNTISAGEAADISGKASDVQIKDVLSNYTDVRSQQQTDITDKGGNAQSVLVFTKQTEDGYQVVKAVPDAESKELKIIEAYKSDAKDGNNVESIENVKEAFDGNDEEAVVSSKEESEQNLANDEDMGYKENEEDKNAQTEKYQLNVIEKNTKLIYKHNPMDNQKAAKDIVYNSNAVYGYSPKPGSSLDEFVSKIDWSNWKQVEDARLQRIKYHRNLKKQKIALEQKLNRLLKEGYSIEEVAKIFVKARNDHRIETYIKQGNYEGLEAMKARNLKLYKNPDGPTIEQLFKRYGSWEEIIYASVRSNLGMDACTGLYDEVYGGD